jgi:diguanylate cyclase (GGDEF)-like protein/PAS domain S-box-containing protein
MLGIVRRWLSIGETETPLGRMLLLEQFRILTGQVPVLYGVLLVDGASVGFVLPPSLPFWLRFGLPGALFVVSVVRMLQWVKKRGHRPTPEQALRLLTRAGRVTALLNVGFALWTLVLFETIDPQLRAPISLVVFMGCVGSAFCLACFPTSARLTLLLSGLPIAVRLLVTGEPLLVCIGVNLALLLALLLRMLNANFQDLANLLASRAKLAAESERARAAEVEALAAQAKAERMAARFDTAISNMSQGLCLFDGNQRLIVCNKRYLEIYGLFADTVRPGISLREIVEMRYAIGSAPAMAAQSYLDWRSSPAITRHESETDVELANGRVVRICHRPMQDGGWVATHEDVTERCRTERALSQAKADAERAEAVARAAHTRLIEALDVVPEGLAIYDADDRLVLWNRPYSEAYSLSADALAPGVPFEDILQAGLMHQQYPEAFGREDEWLSDRLARHRQPQSSHEQHLPGDRWVRVEERRTSDGGSIGVRIDITDLKRREASFRLLFEENPLPMWVADARTLQLLAVNAAMCEHYGYENDRLLTMSEHDLRQNKEADRRVAVAAPRSAKALQGTVAHLTAAGEAIDVIIESRPLRYEGHDAAVSVAFDLTDHKRAEERIRHLAWHDALTDLPNRAALDEQLARTLGSAEQCRGQFAVLSIDLDRFKQINDMFGHAAGDKALRIVAKRLQEAAQGAFIARVGGDEFIATTSQIPLPSSAELLAQRLRAALEREVELHGHSFDLDVSIGIAMYPRDGDTAIALLANADAALYRAKHEGRGAVRLFTAAMDQQLRNRRALEQDLRLAVEKNQLFLEYQPQFHRDGNLIGYEALVRWRHPERGIVSPGEFIPIAEESQIISVIGKWVLREACREAAQWDEPLQIAVNVSAVQFRRDDLPDLVRSVLDESGISPHRLELEITEGVLIQNIARATSVLNALKSLGVRIAIDDFGTGYSSLSYLEAFPLDRIKIDRSFVSSLGRTERSIMIVRAVIGLAHGLGIPALAEGVETSEQLAALKAEGCDDMQGFLLGRPQPTVQRRMITAPAFRSA